MFISDTEHNNTLKNMCNTSNLFEVEENFKRKKYNPYYTKKMHKKS